MNPFTGTWREHIPFYVQSIIAVAVTYSEGSGWGSSGGVIFANGPGSYMGTMLPDGVFVGYPPLPAGNRFKYAF